MKAIRLVSMIIVLLVVGAFITLRVLTIDVPVGHVGVRTQEYGLLGKRGVVEKDFTPGWHRDLGPIDSWTLFQSTVQTLEMTRDPDRGDRKGRDDVQIRSADGYTVSVDVTVKYRIVKGSAHMLYQNTGSGTKYKTIVRNEAQKICMGVFGQMNTEDFYDPGQRRNRSTEAQRLLAESLEDNFVDVIVVLIRDVQFDPEYEEKIRQKKLADQEVELNRSLAKAAEKAGETQVIEAETSRRVRVIQEEKEAEIKRMENDANLQIAGIMADAEKFATEKKADADLIAAQNEAEGELLVKMAEAEGESLRNKAMQGVGGSTIVALEAAKNLNIQSATISTADIDLLDLDDMATRLGAPRTE